MKLMDIYRRLVEAKSRGLLYHFTNYEDFVEILKSDRLRAKRRDSDPDGTVSVSLTRSYLDPFGETSTVRIVLDGDKIAQRLKIRPHMAPNDWNDDEHRKEAEERVFSDIYPLSNYILQIDFKDEIQYEYPELPPPSELMSGYDIPYEMMPDFYWARPTSMDKGSSRNRMMGKI